MPYQGILQGGCFCLSNHSGWGTRTNINAVAVHLLATVSTRACVPGLLTASLFNLPTYTTFLMEPSP